jgi:hypothetical protein
LDPGLRRDDGRSAIAVRTKREMHLRPPGASTNWIMASEGRDPFPRWAPSLEDVIQSACQKMVENFCPISTVGDLVDQLVIGAFPRIFGDFSLITGPISHFLQPLTDKANWITSSLAGVTEFLGAMLVRLLGFLLDADRV